MLNVLMFLLACLLTLGSVFGSLEVYKKVYRENEKRDDVTTTVLPTPTVTEIFGNNEEKLTPEITKSQNNQIKKVLQIRKKEEKEEKTERGDGD